MFMFAQLFVKNKTLTFYLPWYSFGDATLKKMSAQPLQISEDSTYSAHLGFLLFQRERWEGGEGGKRGRGRTGVEREMFKTLELFAPTL